MRIVRYALPIVLMLAAAPTPASAQPVCHPIRRGESATQVARRVTGDGRNAYQTWFEIKNSSSRSVPKSQYNRVRPGWLACFARPRIRSAPSNANVLRVAAPAAADVPDVTIALATAEVAEEAGAPAKAGGPEGLPLRVDSVPVSSDVPRAIGVDLTMVWLGAAMVMPWLGWRVLDDYLARRKTTSIVMRHYAQRFVDEFERPLARYDAEPPLRSQFRRGTRRGRFDILIAPGEGRRYPNLSDHKKNVEYDVARVMHALADDSFASGPLSTNAGWVVIPFQFKSGPKRSGVSCISSF